MFVNNVIKSHSMISEDFIILLVKKTELYHLSFISSLFYFGNEIHYSFIALTFNTVTGQPCFERLDLIGSTSSIFTIKFN